MSRCDSCSGRAERPCEYAALTKEFYDALMPALRFVAERCGYALAVHGSLKTDIDLIAAPWREHCVSQQTLAEYLRVACEQIIGIAEFRGDATEKPCGRLAWSIHLQPAGVRGPYIDLSVMPEGKH